jgi:hypothetical protein
MAATLNGAHARYGPSHWLHRGRETSGSLHYGRCEVKSLTFRNESLPMTIKRGDRLPATDESTTSEELRRKIYEKHCRMCA